jgi:hypothetical protein
MMHPDEVIEESRPSGPNSLPQWRERVESWQRSGLSQREFCLRHGFSPSTFSRQVRRLGKSSEAETPLVQPSGEAPGWLEVRMSPSGLERACQLGEGFELVLAERWRVRLGPHFDAAGLRRLIGVLEGPSC